MANNSVDAVISSIPWTLEPKYIAELMQELMRVLTPEGVIWINQNEVHKKVPSANEAVVKAMHWIIEASCPKGGVILDPFMGSAATGNMALYMDRRFIGVDIDGAVVVAAHQKLHGIHKSRIAVPA